MPSFDEKDTFIAMATAETESAIKVNIKDKGWHWIPQSQIDDDSEVYKKGQNGKLVISRWIAVKKGLVASDD